MKDSEDRDREKKGECKVLLTIKFPNIRSKGIKRVNKTRVRLFE